VNAYTAFVDIVRTVLFYGAAAAGAIALVDWLARTRRINPFGPLPRFMRSYVDPLMLPVERRIVRAGGQPSSAPWWTLVAVVVGGLVLISLLEFIARLAAELSTGFDKPEILWKVLLSWAFGLLRLALIIRVVSTWFSISPYSWWIRWTYPMTDWMLKPLRRMLPLFGPIDVSPLVAWLLLGLIQGAMLR